jgi:hypothetical protein
MAAPLSQAVCEHLTTAQRQLLLELLWKAERELTEAEAERIAGSVWHPRLKPAFPLAALQALIQSTIPMI